VKKIKEAFEFFDVDNSKTITWDEIIVFQGKEFPKDLL